MKIIASLVVAAALAAPVAASAQRVTTPGTFERHERNLDQSTETVTVEKRVASNERSEQQNRVPAAKAGKVNLSTPTVGASS